MRELKFRTFAEAIKKMTYFDGPSLNCTQEGNYGMFFKSTRGGVYLGNNIPMQFTGHHDKDGQDIYEEDVCELEVDFEYIDVMGDNVQEHLIHTGVVKYRPSLGFYLKISKTFDVDEGKKCLSHPELKPIVQRRLKKIGNSFENPEILNR